MKIFGINGSPRKNGNTAKLMTSFLKGALPNDTEPQIFHLGHLRVRGCVGCMVCRQMNGCAVRDDMQILYKAILENDAFVFGFPIYMGQMTAFAKAFTDRLYALLNPDFTPRLNGTKKIFWLISQGNGDEMAYHSYLEQTENLFSMLGYTTAQRLVVSVEDKEHVENACKKSFDIGKKI